MKSLSNINVVNLERYFYELAEKSQDIFWIKKLDYKTQLYISPAYEDIWGVSCESLYNDGGSWLSIIHPADKEKVDAMIHQIKCESQEGKHYLQEYRIVRADHDIRQIQDVCFPLFDVNHQLMGFAGIAKDITEEKERIAELEKASLFFHFFAEKIRSVFWARDNSCNTQIYLSPGYEKIWGRSRDSLYANPATWIETLVPEDQIRHTAEARIRTLREEGPDIEYEDRYRIYRPDGEIRWIKDTSFPIYNEKNKFIGFAGIAEDITNEVLHEQELQEAKQRA